MENISIKNKLDPLLKQLSTKGSFDSAEKVVAELSNLLKVKTSERFLANISRVDAELTRFQLAPGFARQAAAYELPHEDDKPFDLKLFWIKKANKTNLSWIIGLTPNFEDAEANDYKNIGIDFVVPEACDSVIVLLSNRFKVRALELKDHITPTQLEILSLWEKIGEMEITDKNELKRVLHLKLWESFNFEPINRRFYLELVEHFSILVHHLEKDLGRKQSVMFTTRLIGRLLFIWFLKKKNLINEKINYFSVPDPEKQTDYYKNQLEDLFFEVLNKESGRSNGDKLTPYLNGGLFDKNTTDFYGDPKLTFPNGYFNQLFATLNKYNFTVDESSPEFQHVAIDPEMLGRIFESLLAEQIDENTGNSKKKATGAFYTPREIVSYMCEQSLIEYLKTKVSHTADRDSRLEELVRMPEAMFRDQDQNKRDKWRKNLGKDKVLNALDDILMLDPAVGSGAFPMGMLSLLVKVYSRIDTTREKDLENLKREILSRSIYGVDIEQTAIEICRLRAWLSIVVDIPEGGKVEPLPNLDFKFVCANTLIPLDDSKQATFFTDHDLKDKLISIRDEYFKTSSKIKKEKLQKDYLKLTQNTSFFDNKKTTQLKSYRPFDISSSAEFYDQELMHGVKAFDIVIGNPPYVGFGVRGSEKISQAYKKEILKLYPDSAEYKINLYSLFIEKALILCKNNGTQSFIVPDSFLLGKYFSKIRKYILNNAQIIKILLFSEPVFEAVVGYSVVYVFKKTIERKGDVSVIKVSSPDLMSLDSFSYPQTTFDKTLLNRFRLYSNGKEKNFVEKIEEQKKSIKDLVEFKSGLISKNGQKEIICEEKKNKEWYSGIISGGEVGRYSIQWEGNYIRYKKDIIKSGYENVSYFEDKIFVRQTGDKIISAFDDVGYLCLNNVHVGNLIKKIYKPSTITAILNSRLINKYYEIISLEKGRVMAQIDIDVLDSIPVPNIDEKKEEQIRTIVDQIIILKKQNKDADTKNLESQIDELVYKLYGLTDPEIKIIENSK